MDAGDFKVFMGLTSNKNMFYSALCYLVHLSSFVLYAELLWFCQFFEGRGYV